MTTTDRRRSTRKQTDHSIKFRYKGPESDYLNVTGVILSVSDSGLSCRFSSPIWGKAKIASFELTHEGLTVQQSGQIIWKNKENTECGLRFDGEISTWKSFLDQKAAVTSETSDRRGPSRRTSERSTMLDFLANSEAQSKDRRQQGRRYSDLLQDFVEENDAVDNTKVKTFLRSKATTFTEEVITARREWMANATKTRLSHIGHFSEDLSQFVGKIENPIGVVHTPLGIAGPLKIKGDHARGTFFIPMATTEGALVTSYTLGSHLITRSGGTTVTVLSDELHIGPIFVFRTLLEARAFTTWTDRHFEKIKELAEQTSHHLHLKKLVPLINGRRVILNFHYETEDAMGMNMACKGTDAACRYITATVKPEEFWLRSNFNANKKVTANNLINGYGKAVTADITIPRRLIYMLKTTPEDMEKYYTRTVYAGAQAVQIGTNGHFANAVAAIFLACGQDVASVANSHVGITTIETTKAGDLYASVFVSNLLVGTVGGGTAFGTSRECLGILGCFGPGKAKKFAEIIAATALAGEIGICIAITNGTYVFAHETFGRNRPVPLPPNRD